MDGSEDLPGSALGLTGWTDGDDVGVFDQGVDQGDGEDDPELRCHLKAVATSSRSEVNRVSAARGRTNNAMSSMQKRSPR